MKLLFVFLIFLFAPIAIQASPHLHYDKATVLKLAHQHLDNGIAELKKAEKICWYVPDLGDRKHLKALIAGAITSAPIKNPKDKILAMGITIIASVMDSMQDKYLEIVGHLEKASYHFEMTHFYNDLSQRRHLYPDTSEGTKCLFDGIDHLTRAIMHAENIHPSYGQKGEDLRDELVLTLTQYRKEFVADQDKLCDRSWAMYENIHEIAISGKPEFRSVLEMYVRNMHEEFLKAEKAWAKERRQKKK
jgi:hypothetical protein